MLRTLFVDFNSYFASVEQQIKPHLRGRPVGVVPLMADTTCCIAASYEAKAFGVRTGTPVAEARRLCPGITFIEARHEIYVEFHQRAVEAVGRIAPVRQVLSIDEMECELTGSWRNRDKAVQVAEAIKQEVQGTVGECLRSSIGIAPNTLLGKLASNMNKPDGLTVLEQADLPHALFHLPPSAIQGVGKRMLERLNRAGIHTMEQLCTAPRDVLHTVWGGIGGDEMHDMLRGQWYGPRQTVARSLGHSHVLPPELRHAEGALGVLNRLTQKAAMRLRKQGFYATAMSVSVRCGHRYQKVSGKDDGASRDTQFGEMQDTGFFLQVLHQLWHTGLQNLREPKMVNVTLHGLVLATQHTPSLFDAPAQVCESDTAAPVASSPRQNQAMPERRDRGKLDAAMDKVNKTYGKNSLYFASAHDARDAAPMRIAFNRIPDVETEA
ncbi:MAG: DNA-directed DNA polymerase [Comamonadaceae bacterium]|nr:MAG: DNA-directed DNA polymerase [Comamonadaceae bacterium]